MALVIATGPEAPTPTEKDHRQEHGREVEHAACRGDKEQERAQDGNGARHTQQQGQAHPGRQPAHREAADRNAAHYHQVVEPDLGRGTMQHLREDERRSRQRGVEAGAGKGAAEHVAAKGAGTQQGQIAAGHATRAGDAARGRRLW